MRIILQSKASNHYACQAPPEGFGNSLIHFIEKYCFSSDKYYYLESTKLENTKLSELFLKIEVYCIEKCSEYPMLTRTSEFAK